MLLRSAPAVGIYRARARAAGMAVAVLRWKPLEMPSKTFLTSIADQKQSFDLFRVTDRDALRRPTLWPTLQNYG